MALSESVCRTYQRFVSEDGATRKQGEDEGKQRENSTRCWFEGHGRMVAKRNSVADKCQIVDYAKGNCPVTQTYLLFATFVSENVYPRKHGYENRETQNSVGHSPSVSKRSYTYRSVIR